MSKPRLAEILGVEVEERFDIGSKYKNCFVNRYGNLLCESEDVNWQMEVMTFCEMIKGEMPIWKKGPRWTKQDVEDAKAMIRLFRNIAYIQRSGDKLLFEQQLGDSGMTVTIPTSNPWLPSLRVGKTVKLSEILRAEPVE